ncbi:PF20097 family protein [Candidatus Bathyarchaeota archaeon]|jgi:hypothetical protein|nr:PF20097 family protein [Candidatus Bathyarchaeota archaeon]
MPVCPKCGNEMREGEAFVPVSVAEVQTSTTPGMLGMPGVSMPSIETSRDEKVLWRERVGEKRGLFGRSGLRIIRIQGMRCVQCGYIEFYAQG